MFNKTIPEASLNKDSIFRCNVSLTGILRPLLTDSIAVASVGVLIAAKINANGKPTPAVAQTPKPAKIMHKITKKTAIPIM